MSRSLALAWLAGLGLLTWREVAAYRKPPPAGRLAAASGVFAALGLLSQYQPAAGAAALAAWGFDLAVLLQPGMLPGTAAPPKAAQATPAAAGTTAAA